MDPIKRNLSRQLCQFGLYVDVANQIFTARLQQQQVFKQCIERSNEVLRSGFALGPGPVRVCRFEELCVIPGLHHGTQQRQGIIPGGNVFGQIEALRASNRPFRESANEFSLLGLEISAFPFQIVFDLVVRQRGKSKADAAGTNCRQEFSGIRGKKNQAGKLGRLLQDFQQRVRRLFHERRLCKDVNLAAALDRFEVHVLDHLPDLPDFNQHLWRIRWNDHHFGVGPDQNAGVLLVDLSQRLPCLHRLLEALLQIVR